MRLKLVFTLMMQAMMLGCGFNPARETPATLRASDKPTTVVATAHLAETLADAVKVADGVLDAAKSLTVENLSEVKPMLIERATGLREALATKAKAQVETAKAAAVEDAKREQAKDVVIEKKTAEIVELKKADPVKFWLNVTGWVLVLGGIAVWGLSAWVKLFTLPYIDAACSGSIVFGFLLWGIAYYIGPIRIIAVCVGGAAIVAYAIYYATHRKISQLSSPAQPGAVATTAPAQGAA